jgi:hypothetical protein
MATIDQKTQNALDEGRTLILGAQILLGALYRAVLEPGYVHFSLVSQRLVLVALALNIISVVFLMAPVPYHRIVEKGKDDREFNAFVEGAMAVALVPFAASVGLSLYVFFDKVVGGTWSLVLGCSSVVLAGTLWYGLWLMSGLFGARIRGKERKA